MGKEFQKGADRRKALLEQQAEINATKTAESELNTRLNVAMVHLMDTGNDLAKQKESIRSFLRKLGSHPEEEKVETKVEAKVALKEQQKQSKPIKHVVSLASVSKGVKKSGKKPAEGKKGKHAKKPRSSQSMRKATRISLLQMP